MHPWEALAKAASDASCHGLGKSQNHALQPTSFAGKALVGPEPSQLSAPLFGGVGERSESVGGQKGGGSHILFLSCAYYLSLAFVLR